MEVNTDRVQLLVADLRSGTRIQGHGHLTQKIDGEDHDCCLGVGCKVAIANGLEGLEVHLPGSNIVDYVWTGTDPDGTSYESSESSVLPSVVWEWYGFPAAIGGDVELTAPDGARYHATSLNDELCWDLEQIATAFEVTFLGGTYPPEAITWPGMPGHVPGMPGRVAEG